MLAPSPLPSGSFVSPVSIPHSISFFEKLAMGHHLGKHSSPRIGNAVSEAGSARVTRFWSDGNAASSEQATRPMKRCWRTRSTRRVTACLLFVLLGLSTAAAPAEATSPATAAAPAQAAPAGSATPPNFVVIFIDDLGYADIGPFGATKQRTPRLDRMAREGMKLTSFYAAPVCSVSRAQLLTGCYGPRVSVPGVFFPGQRQGLNPAETTVAEYLKARGYATACVGKWHLGDQPEFLPTRQGFDRYLGIPYSNDMQRVATATGQRVSPLLRDDKVAELLTDDQQSRIVERYTDEAKAFIRDNAERPFFLYLPHTAVHTPIYPGSRFAGQSNNGRFGDWVEEVDWSVGELLDLLAELKLDERTLVLFTSDNGPWLIKGPDGGSALPLRGGKGSTWEGGVRVPTLARWPGKIAAGSRCDAVAGTIDILPTFVTLAGGQVPAEPVIDGRDISGLLLGRTTESAREAHYYFSGNQLQAVRQGPWKLAVATQPETMGRGVAADANRHPRLYNLDQEIGEQTDLSAQHPEVVLRLQALAEKIRAAIAGDSPAARRPPGLVDNPRTLYPSETPAAKPAAKPAGPQPPSAKPVGAKPARAKPEGAKPAGPKPAGAQRPDRKPNTVRLAISLFFSIACV
ncbi:MAG: hypothetical protein RLY70_376 [Planctomycetota bacterium]